MDYFWDACYAVGLTSNPSLASIPIFAKECQRDLQEYYEVSPETIAHGSFGYIRRVKPIPNPNGSEDGLLDQGVFDRWYASKTIPKSHLYDREFFRREVYNLNRCQRSGSHGKTGDNYHIVRLIDVLEDRYHVHIVTELCQGGELYDYILKEHRRTGRGLRGKALSPSSNHDDDDDELRCATIIFQILTAFRFLHEDARVCHRDMKASNFIFVQTPSFLPGSLNLRVIDFGLSKYVGKEPMNRPIDPAEVALWMAESEDDVCDDSSREFTPIDAAQVALRRAQSEDSDCDESRSFSLKDSKKSKANMANSTNCAHDDDDDHLYSKHYQYMTSDVGTPYYVAPEVLTRRVQEDQKNNIISETNIVTKDRMGYSTKCDMWSIGVLTFLTLTGTLPVMGSDEEETIQKLMDPNLEVDFSDDSLWEQHCDCDDKDGQQNDNDNDPTTSKKNRRISLSAQRLCKALLQRDPNKRPTAREALQYDWIVKHCGDSALGLQTDTGIGMVGAQHNSRPYVLPSLSTRTGRP